MRPALLRLRGAGGTLRLLLWAGLLLAMIVLRPSGAAASDIELPQPNAADPIEATAEAGNRWTLGVYEVWILRGNCSIRQGASTVRAAEVVLWIDRTGDAEADRNKVIVYAEGNVTLDFQADGKRSRLTDSAWLGRLYTAAAVEVRADQVAGEPEVPPGVYRRAMARRNPIADGAVHRTEFQEGSLPVAALPAGARRVRVFPRSDVPVQAQWFPDRQTGQWIAVIESGVTLIVDGLPELGSIDVSTDRLVIWTTGLEEPDLSGRIGQAQNVPFEIYMEGNIEFRQGDRVIFADRMYYDVTRRAGIVLGAELLTPVPNYEGLLRLQAQVLQQLDRDRFYAQNLFATSSRMGKPGYRLQVNNATFQDTQRQAVDPWTGAPLVDPETREPVIEHQRLATGRNNFLFIRDVPIFYWPVLATDLTEPTFYLRSARMKNDSVFGTQILTTWNAYQLLGIRKPPAGTDWDISLDYLSKRGFGHGTNFSYSRDTFLGLQGPVSGLVDYWGIADSGLDNLGRDRRDLQPEVDYRHRLFWQHRQLLAGDLQLTAEAGWISDRNFLEEYYEREWDELKDEATGVELKRTYDNISWSVSADYRINDFFTQTDWLPRADHFWLGQQLFNETLTWYEHSSAAYARFHTLTPPKDPADLASFSYLPWETDPLGNPLSTESERFVTRQEIDYPFLLGPIKVVPYALGELAHWGEDRSGNDLQRAYGQLGVRASMPIWAVNPYAESELWNVHGLAHKITLEAEFSWTDASQDMTELPLYDPLDDDSIEAFRRRLAVNTFGPGTGFGGPPAPLRFDERFYALRTGMAGWVTAPSTEIADDLLLVRIGARQRWQTKRGTPGQMRIIDWVTLDTHLSLFPDPSRDDFGSAAGLLDYDFRWNVGDRLALTSTGGFDFFDSGQQVITVGGFLTRPPRGSLYLGVRMLGGPISSTVLSASYTYRMSPKWVSAAGMSVDLSDEGNIGESLAVTRIGESFLFTASLNVDSSRNNVGFNIAVEPRFLPRTRLGQAGGARIPVAGAYGLE